VLLVLACGLAAHALGTPAQGKDKEKDKDTRTVARLTQDIASKDEAKAASALNELGRRGAAGIDPLLHATKDARTWVRMGGWLGLAEIGKPALRALPAIAVAARESSRPITNMIELSVELFDSNVDLAQKSLNFHTIGSDLAAAVAKDMATLENDFARFAPMRAVVLVGGHDLPKLLELVTSGPAPKDDLISDIEVAFAEAVKLNPAPGIPLLQAEITGKDPRRRRFALIAASALGEESTPLVADMCALLSDADPDAQQQTLEALCALGAPADAWQTKLDELSASPDARVRLSAARAHIYCRKKPDAAVPLLLALSEDPSVSIRSSSIWELGSLSSATRGKLRPNAPTGVRPKGVVERLLPRLKDTSIAVINTTVTTLGNFGAEAKVAVPQLRTLAASGHETTRPLAKKALELIGS
jgi:hypothetical protein